MAESWFRWTPARAAPRLRLLCLPPAGSGAGFFRACAAWMPADVELVAYRPRGRDARLEQPAPRAFADYLADAAAELPALATVPVAVWGHSLGGLVAFELARRLAPRFVVATAVAAPQLVTPSGLERASDAELAGVLRSYGGTPPELLEDAELLALLIDALRADYACVATYAPGGGPLDVPLFAAGGRGDAVVPLAELAAWRAQTTAPFACELFDGGHFFVAEPASGFATWLADKLA